LRQVSDRMDSGSSKYLCVTALITTWGRFYEASFWAKYYPGILDKISSQTAANYLCILKWCITYLDSISPWCL
jgi:hypothetical protein